MERLPGRRRRGVRRQPHRADTMWANHRHARISRGRANESWRRVDEVDPRLLRAAAQGAGPRSTASSRRPLPDRAPLAARAPGRAGRRGEVTGPGSRGPGPASARPGQAPRPSCPRAARPRPTRCTAPRSAAARDRPWSQGRRRRRAGVRWQRSLDARPLRLQLEHDPDSTVACRAASFVASSRPTPAAPRRAAPPARGRPATLRPRTRASGTDVGCARQHALHPGGRGAGQRWDPGGQHGDVVAAAAHGQQLEGGVPGSGARTGRARHRREQRLEQIDPLVDVQVGSRPARRCRAAGRRRPAGGTSSSTSSPTPSGGPVSTSIAEGVIYMLADRQREQRQLPGAGHGRQPGVHVEVDHQDGGEQVAAGRRGSARCAPARRQADLRRRRWRVRRCAAGPSSPRPARRRPCTSPTTRTRPSSTSIASTSHRRRARRGRRCGSGPRARPARCGSGICGERGCAGRRCPAPAHYGELAFALLVAAGSGSIAIPTVRTSTSMSARSPRLRAGERR